MSHHAEFTSAVFVGAQVTGVSSGTNEDGQPYRTVWSGKYEGIHESEWTGEPVHYFTGGIIGSTPQGCFAIPVSQFTNESDYERGKRDREQELAELHPNDRQRIFDAYNAAKPILFGETDEDKELFSEAIQCAGDCDTCWYLCSDQTEIPRTEVIAKVRAHLASGHTTTTTEDDTYRPTPTSEVNKRDIR
jgi:hypothetical protein